MREIIQRSTGTSESPWSRNCPPPLILYVGAAQRPCPAHAFGETERPDLLIHLVLDVLARLRS